MTWKKQHPALKKQTYRELYQQLQFSVAGRPLVKLFPAVLYETAIAPILSRLLAVASLFIFLSVLTAPASEAQVVNKPDAHSSLPVISEWDALSLKHLDQRPELNHLSRLPILPTVSKNLLPQFIEKAPETSPLWEPWLHERSNEIETSSEEEQYRQELEKEVEDRKNVEATQGYKTEEIPFLTPPAASKDSQHAPPPDPLAPEDADSGQNSKGGSSKTTDSNTQEQAAAGDSSAGDSSAGDSSAGDSSAGDSSAGNSEAQNQPESNTAVTSTPPSEGTEIYHLFYVAGNFQADSRSCVISTDSATAEEGEDPQQDTFSNCHETSQLNEDFWGDPPTFYYNDSPQNHLLNHLETQMDHVIKHVTDQKPVDSKRKHLVVNVILMPAGIHDDTPKSGRWPNTHRSWLKETLTEKVSSWNERLGQHHSPSTLTINVWIKPDQAAYYYSLTQSLKDGEEAVLLSESNALLITVDGKIIRSELLDSEHKNTPRGGLKHLGKAITLYCQDSEKQEDCKSALKKALLAQMPISLKNWEKVAGIPPHVGKLNALGKAALNIKRSDKCLENPFNQIIDDLCKQELNDIVTLAKKRYDDTHFKRLWLTGAFIHSIQEEQAPQEKSYVAELVKMLKEKMPTIEIMLVSKESLWEKFESYSSTFDSENLDFSVSSESITEKSLTEDTVEED